MAPAVVFSSYLRIATVIVIPILTKILMIHLRDYSCGGEALDSEHEAFADWRNGSHPWLRYLYYWPMGRETSQP